MNPLLKRSDMARDSKGVTQFYLYSRTIPAFTTQPQGITAVWLVLITPTHGGMARLSWPGWLVIYWDRFSGTGDWTLDTVTHLSTNRARRKLTSLIETNALTTTPNRQGLTQTITVINMATAQTTSLCKLRPRNSVRQTHCFIAQLCISLRKNPILTYAFRELTSTHLLSLNDWQAVWPSKSQLWASTMRRSTEQRLAYSCQPVMWGETLLLRKIYWS